MAQKDGFHLHFGKLTKLTTMSTRFGCFVAYSAALLELDWQKFVESEIESTFPPQPRTCRYPSLYHDKKGQMPQRGKLCASGFLHLSASIPRSFFRLMFLTCQIFISRKRSTEPRQPGTTHSLQATIVPLYARSINIRSLYHRVLDQSALTTICPSLSRNAFTFLSFGCPSPHWHNRIRSVPTIMAWTAVTSSSVSQRHTW